MYTEDKVGFGWLRMIRSGNIQVVEATYDVLSLLFNLVSPHANNAVIAGIFRLLMKQGYLLHHWK